MRGPYGPGDREQGCSMMNASCIPYSEKECTRTLNSLSMAAFGEFLVYLIAKRKSNSGLPRQEAELCQISQQKSPSFLGVF